MFLAYKNSAHGKPKVISHFDSLDHRSFHTFLIVSENLFEPVFTDVFDLREVLLDYE